MLIYIGLDTRGKFSLSSGRGFGKSVIIFSTDMSYQILLIYIDNKK